MRESVLTSVLFTLTFPPPHCRGKERVGEGGKADSAKPSQAILLKGKEAIVENADNATRGGGSYF